MTSFGKLDVGLTIEIQRSDGRIHPAVITALNGDGAVTVEWFEGGETKGKEIDLEMVKTLNSHLFDDVTTVNHPVPEVSAKVSKEKVAAQPPVPRPTTAVRRNDARQSGVVRKRGTVNNDESYIMQQQPPPNPVPSFNSKKEDKSRRSNVVNEVERLKKNREDRRAKQAEVLQEKQQLIEKLGPSSPYWEFSKMIAEFKAGLVISQLNDHDVVKDHQICVCVRKRPINSREQKRKDVDVVTIPNKESVIIHEPKVKVDLVKYLDNQTFRFDYSFNEQSNNQMVYKYTAKPLVRSIFDGGMATCFAYGQTGSGKTHTMGGDFTAKGQQECSKGIYMLSATDIFNLNRGKYASNDLQVSCSFFEIYSGKVYDLLNSKEKLRVLEDGNQNVNIVGLKEYKVANVDDVLSNIVKGSSCRTSGQTSANNNSSRSHAVFQFILRDKRSQRLHGKFSLIDLAGNERGKDTESSNRQTRFEGAEINKSLLALKECIRALGRTGAHLPFRVSKLTHVLRDSFIGDKAKTCMIATISPGISSCEHTLNTLRYADRVKELFVADSKRNPVPEGSPQRHISDNDSVLSISELHMLRDQNDPEFDDDMFQLQETIEELQNMEDDVVDSHKRACAELPRLSTGLVKLLTMTSAVDYDRDSYAVQLRSYVHKCQAVLANMHENLAVFEEKLTAEDKAAKKMSKRGGTTNGN